MNKEIKPEIFSAVEKMKTRLGGIKVTILSKEMYQPSNSNYYGVDITIDGVETFLPYNSTACEIALRPYGSLVADDYIKNTLTANALKKIK